MSDKPLKKTCATCKYRDKYPVFHNDPPIKPQWYYCEKKRGYMPIREACIMYRSVADDDASDLREQLGRIADALEEMNERMKWNR